MAATQDNGYRVRGVQNMLTMEYPVKAAALIYAETLIGIDSGTGYARPLVAADKFVGVAKFRVDNSSGASGDNAVETMSCYQILSAMTGATADQTAVGTKVYASADNALTTTSSGNSLMGVIQQYDIPTGKFWVEVLDPAKANI